MRLESAWSLEGTWTSVVSDESKGAIYALGRDGKCVELNLAGKQRREFEIPDANGSVLRIASLRPGAEPQALWIKDLLLACGFKIHLKAKQETFAAQAKKHLFVDAVCVYGVVAAEKSSDSPYPYKRPSEAFLSLVQTALESNLRVAVLAERDLEVPKHLQERCEWWSVDFSDPKAILNHTPVIVRHALHMKRCDQQGIYPFDSLGESTVYTYFDNEDLMRGGAIHRDL